MFVLGAGPRGGQPRPGLCHGAGVAAGEEAGAGAAAGRAAADQARPHDRARGAHEGAQGELAIGELTLELSTGLHEISQFPEKAPY